MKSLPTTEEIKNLHKKHAPSDAAFDLVFTHCEIVWEIAEQLIRSSQLAVDAELVRVGCLLHDIGVYRLYNSNGEIDHKNYIQHGVLGDELLEQEGYDERLRRIASCHTGVGLTKADIAEGNLPMPSKDYLAETPEERLVMYADKFHTKTTPPKLLSVGAYSRDIGRFGEHKVEKFKQLQEEFGIPDLTPLVKKYGLEIVEA